ncbi:MAG: sigma-70 family RNA polymerase sigma factor [Deltaproteobacteria bacterium]|nr:sigma-70 family RNA polymerase sigma factor [Deltaproteobacteria bacterium]
MTTDEVTTGPRTPFGPFPTERELIRAACGRDHVAWATIVRIHYYDLVGIGLRHLGRKNLAEEGAQQGLLNAYDHTLGMICTTLYQGEYQGDGKLGPYLRTVVANASKDLAAKEYRRGMTRVPRKQRTELRFTTEDAAAAGAADPAPGMAELEAADILRDAIVDGIKELDRLEQLLLDAYCIKAMTLSDIGKLYGPRLRRKGDDDALHPSNVQRRLSGIRKTLRTKVLVRLDKKGLPRETLTDVVGLLAEALNWSEILGNTPPAEGNP